MMSRENVFLWKVVLGGAAAILVAALLFFNFENILTWMTLNDPFQGQFVVVQLSDGEIVYGHLSGVTASTIGLTDVYLLDKISPLPSALPADTTSSSTDLLLGGTVSAPSASSTFVPVSVAPVLYVNRAGVLYFKFVPADDPALPYLH